MVKQYKIIIYDRFVFPLSPPTYSLPLFISHPPSWFPCFFFPSHLSPSLARHPPPLYQSWALLAPPAGAVATTGHRADCCSPSILPSHLQFCHLGVLRGEIQNPFFLFSSSFDSKMVESVIF